MCHGNEEWRKIWRGIDLPFQNWHEKFDKFWAEHLTVPKVFILVCSFWAKHILFKLKKYRVVIFHETKEGYKIRRVIDLSFQNWHKGFDKFWPEHSKVSNICDILISELRVTSYKLIALPVELIARVKSYELFLLHELLVTFSIRVTSYYLLHELRVTFYIRVTSYCFLIHGPLNYSAIPLYWFLKRSPWLKADWNSTKVPISNANFSNKVPISESYPKNVILPESLKLLCPFTVKNPFNFYRN